MIKRTIYFKQQKMELEMSDEFLKRVAEYYLLESVDEISDKQLLTYFHSTIKVGVDKAEKELNDVK